MCRFDERGRVQGFDAGGALTLKPGWSVDSKNFSIRPAVKAGGLIFVAGQIGLNPDGSMPEKPEQQFVNAFNHSRHRGPRPPWFDHRDQGCRRREILDVKNIRANCAFRTARPQYLKSASRQKRSRSFHNCSFRELNLSKIGFPNRQPAKQVEPLDTTVSR